MRALAIDPERLLMDQPFAGLATQTRELMQAELSRIWSEARKTVIFIRHQMAGAASLADRVLIASARPQALKVAILGGIPHPRSLAVRSPPARLERVDAIWCLIEEERRYATVPWASAGDTGARL